VFCIILWGTLFQLWKLEMMLGYVIGWCQSGCFRKISCVGGISVFRIGFMAVSSGIEPVGAFSGWLRMGLRCVAIFLREWLIKVDGKVVVGEAGVCLMNR